MSSCYATPSPVMTQEETLTSLKNMYDLDQQSSTMDYNNYHKTENELTPWKQIGPTNHGQPFDQTVIVIFVLFLIVILWRYFYRSFLLLRVRLGLAQPAPQDVYEFEDVRMMDDLKLYTDPPPSYEEVTRMSSRYPLVISTTEGTPHIV